MKKHLNMKKFILTFVLFLISYTSFSQLRYGVSAGLNISGGILPDLSINKDVNAILNGEDVVQGTPQLADFTVQYKAGFFVRLDHKIGSAKIYLNYTSTNIKKDLDLNVYSVDALNLEMNYIDLDLIYSLNFFPFVHWNLGYSPSFLISDSENNPNINDFDSRILTGFGVKLAKGTTIDLNIVVGINEVIDGSYIHHLMIPLTVSIPLN